MVEGIAKVTIRIVFSIEYFSMIKILGELGGKFAQLTSQT